MQHRLGEPDRLLGAVRHRDLLALVLRPDELAGPTHHHLVDQVEQVLRRQRVRIPVLGVLDVRVDRPDARRGELGVVADEQPDQGVQVEQRVVHRRCRQQHDLLRVASRQQAAHHLGLLRGRVPKVVRLVDHYHRVLVKLVAQVLVLLPPVPQLGVRVDLDAPRHVVLVQERFPHRRLQRRRRDDQHPLAGLVGGPAHHLGSHERLAQADLVGDDHAVVLVEDPQHPRHALALEAREPHRRHQVVVGHVAVQLEQHPQEHQPRRMRIPPARIQPGQVVGVGLGPEVLKPVLHQMGVLTGRVAEVQLGVTHQPRVGEVRRTGQHRRHLGMLGDVRLAVQEPLRVPAHLDKLPAGPLGLEPGHHAPRRPVLLTGEPRQVPFTSQPLDMAGNRSTRLLIRDRRNRSLADRRIRFSPQHQANRRRLLQLVGQQLEPRRVQISRRYRHRSRIGEHGPPTAKQLQQLFGNRLAVIRTVRRKERRVPHLVTRHAESFHRSK